VGVAFGNNGGEFIEFSAPLAREIRAYHLNLGQETRCAIKKNGRLASESSERQMQSINLCSPPMHRGQKISFSLLSACGSRVFHRPIIPLLGENMIEVSSDESSTDESSNQRQVKRWVIWHLSAGALGLVVGPLCLLSFYGNEIA